MSENKKKLRAGFTTGTAAAAAVKGAILRIREGVAPSQVRIALLNGESIVIPVHSCTLESERQAVCSVIKDAGDDPDITHKAEIGARVTLPDRGCPESILIRGGQGVGKVTKPGLEIPPGEPAINLGPRKMIVQAVNEALGAEIAGCGLRVAGCGLQGCESRVADIEIFVPRGQEMARKTLNPRLGIVGGISVLGTTGIVRPMSHDAYIATITSALSVARAAGLDRAVLTTGRRSERYAQNLWTHLPEEAFVQIGDFFRSSMEAASEKGFERLTLAVFFGKAVKMAQGVPHTHAAKSDLTMHRLSEWTLEVTKDRHIADEVLKANTARHAFDLLSERHPDVVSHVGGRMVASARRFAGPVPHVHGVIFDYNGEIIFDSLR